MINEESKCISVYIQIQTRTYIRKEKKNKRNSTMKAVLQNKQNISFWWHQKEEEEERNNNKERKEGVSYLYMYRYVYDVISEEFDLEDIFSIETLSQEEKI